MIRRLYRARRAGVGILVAAAMPVLLGATALAVDLGSAMLESRQLQGAADAAAIAAAGDPTRAASLARTAVDASRWPGAVSVTTIPGRYTADPALPATQRFVANATPANAVRVALTTPAPGYFARIFGIRTMPIARTATAAQINLASFSIGSRLAAVDGGVVNGLLGGLTGSTISLSVMDYNALAGAKIDLFGFIDALRTTANVQAGSYDGVLDSNVTTGQILRAAASVAESNGQLSAAAALKLLAAQGGNRTMKLGALIDPGLLGNSNSVTPGAFGLNVMDLVTASLESATPTRQIALDLGATIPGLAQTKAIVAIGERPENSPWLAVSADGNPVLRTAQTRISLQTKIGGAVLGSLVSVNIPLYVEMASAEARLAAIDCSTDASRGVTVEARTGPSTIAIGTVDTSRLQDFTRPLSIGKATLAHLLLIDVNGRATIDLGAAENWQPVRFTQDQIDKATVQTVSSSTAVAGITQSLMSNLQLDVGPLQLGSIAGTIGAVVAPVAPVIDGLIDTITQTLGVHYGQADIRATGLRCGTPALVA